MPAIKKFYPAIIEKVLIRREGRDTPFYNIARILHADISMLTTWLEFVLLRKNGYYKNKMGD